MVKVFLHYLDRPLLFVVSLETDMFHQYSQRPLHRPVVLLKTHLYPLKFEFNQSLAIVKLSNATCG